MHSCIAVLDKPTADVLVNICQCTCLVNVQRPFESILTRNVKYIMDVLWQCHTFLKLLTDNEWMITPLSPPICLEWTLTNVYMSEHQSMSLSPYHCISEIHVFMLKRPCISLTECVQHLYVMYYVNSSVYSTFFPPHMFNCVWGLKLCGFTWAIPIIIYHKDIWFTVYTVVT